MRSIMGKNLLLITADVEKAREQVQQGLSPRMDYLELADALGADVLGNRAVLASRRARLLSRLRRGAGHAWLASRIFGDYDNIFSDGEHIGLLLGMKLSGKRHRSRHVMIGHGLSAWRKRMLGGLARKGIDALIVHCGTQLKFALENLQMDHSQVYLTPYQVDTEFWQPRVSSEELLIVSCGLEHRDYRTLAAAVENLPVGVSIAAASHWSRYGNSLNPKKLPPNVSVGSYDYGELRDLYGRARFVVVPLVDSDYPAGIATVLEAMAMGKAVIVSKTRGQETVIGPLWGAGQDSWPGEPSPEDSTGIYVTPGDRESLHSAIVYLLERPELAGLLGGNARRYVERNLSLEQFVSRLVPIVDPSYALGSATPAHSRMHRV